MTPETAIAILRRQLAAHGQNIRLRRVTQGPGGTQVIYSVECRAFVRGYHPDELVGGIIQGDSKVTLSAAEIEAQGWPGPDSAITTTTLSQQDRRVPRKGDDVRIEGRVRNIENAVPFYLNGELVRIELNARG
jgi:hypothetical protein